MEVVVVVVVGVADVVDVGGVTAAACAVVADDPAARVAVSCEDACASLWPVLREW